MPNSIPQTRNLTANVLLRPVLLVCLLVLPITGCGLKGDLTLEPPTPASAPAQAEPGTDDDDA